MKSVKVSKGNHYFGGFMLWNEKVLGIATVDLTPQGNLAVSHVSVDADGARLTGTWLLISPTTVELENLLAQWILVGTRDGVGRVSKVLGREMPSADLRELVGACELAETQLQEAWVSYRDDEPKKRANLVPPNWPSWPRVNDDHTAAQILVELGRLPYSEGTPLELRDILALTKLVKYVVDCWQELESERLARAYLAAGDPSRNLLPAGWIRTNAGTAS
jgi:hypothetical protein